MMRLPLITACVLALSGSAALAQTNWMPPGPESAPGGVNGAAPTRDVGTSPNVANTTGTTTSSSSLLEQNLKEDSAEQVAMAPMGPALQRHRIASTDSYGFHFDSNGALVDGNGYLITPHTP